MQTKQLSLSTARWIALAMYFTGIGDLPVRRGVGEWRCTRCASSTACT